LGAELEAVVPFALGTGLRRSEICALKWRDIDLTSGTIRVQRGAVNLDGKVVIKATKTRKSLRTDYLAPFVISVLRIHRQQQSTRRKAHGVSDGLKIRTFDGLKFPTP
jgi:integrase